MVQSKDIIVDIEGMMMLIPRIDTRFATVVTCVKDRARKVVIVRSGMQIGMVLCSQLKSSIS